MSKFKNEKVGVVVDALTKLEFKNPHVMVAILMTLNSEFNEPAIMELVNPGTQPKKIKNPVVFIDTSPKASKVTQGCATCGDDIQPRLEKNIIEAFEDTEPEDTMSVLQFFAQDTELMETFAKDHYMLKVNKKSSAESLALQIYREYGNRNMARRK